MRYLIMEYQIKDIKLGYGDHKLNYIASNISEVALKLHEWVEFNYDIDEIRINYISVLEKRESINEVPDSAAMLIILSHAIDYADDRRYDIRYENQYNYFYTRYEEEITSFLSDAPNEAENYCKMLDLFGYIDFKVMED